MATHPPFGSPTFKSVAKGLVALHRLITEGKDDSPEAESVRDALDAPLHALNPIEKQRAQWLSEDLYSVSEPSPATSQKPMDPQAQQRLNEAFEARQNKEWGRALELLRRWRESIAPALLSYLRGSIWLDAGNPDVAAVFLGHASESDPSNANYRAIYMHALERSDPEAARKAAREVLADDKKYAPIVVARAADIRFGEVRTASGGIGAPLYRELIVILEKNIARIDEDEDAASRSAAYEMTFGVMGFCHEFLGNRAAAVNCYSRGLQVNPNNDGLLVARGILFYGSSPGAIADFERAVELGCRSIWPSLFLAHQYLITHRFDQARSMCETALRMPGSDSAKSQLEEWRAIAQAELGFSPELVRAAFDAAVRLDPTNELAKRNQAVFEAFLRVPRTPARSKWSQRSEATVRQFGLAERMYSLAA